MEKKSVIVRRYFRTSAYNKCICKIETCGKVLSGKFANNLSRHLILCHRNVAVQLKLVEDDSDKENSTSTPKKKKVPTVKVEIDADTVIGSCVKLVTSHSLPLAAIGYEGFRQILNPLEKALNIKINTDNIHNHINATSEKFINFIKAEVHQKIVSLKIDSATRLDRHVLGINIQFLKTGKIIIRTIGMIQVTERMTAENLKEIILSVLQKFGITIAQLYSVTTDNGANMIKSVKLLAEIQNLSSTAPEVTGTPENIDDEEEDDGGSTLAETAYYTNTEKQILGILGCVRCAAHTLQLVANAVIGKSDIDDQLTSIRKIVKKLKSSKYRSLFIVNSTKRPVLDVTTRWGSTFHMVSNIIDSKQFYLQLAQNDSEVGFSDDQINFMNNFLESFKPLYLATKKFQSVQLTIGDFFKEWLHCKISLGFQQNQMSIDLKEEMINREHQLFNLNVFIAAIFLDSRFNYINSTNLTEVDKANAKNHLRKLNSTIKNITGLSNDRSETSYCDTSQPSQSTSEISFVEQYLQTRDNEEAVGNVEAIDLEKQLNLLCLKRRLHSDESVLAYWEKKNTNVLSSTNWQKLLLRFPRLKYPLRGRLVL